MAEGPDRPPSRATAQPRLHQGAGRGFHAARRRPPLRRGFGHRRRHRSIRRPLVRDPRSREGRRHRNAHQAQFRHGAAGGLSQGAAPDASCRAVPAPRHRSRRHGRRISGRRCGGARPGRSDRALPRGLPRHPGAVRRRDHRRGRIRRGHRDCRRQSGAHARACHLFGYLARGLRLDSVAQCRAGADGGRSAPAHRAGSAASRGHRRDRAGAARRRAPRAGQGDRDAR